MATTEQQLERYRQKCNALDAEVRELRAMNRTLQGQVSDAFDQVKDATKRERAALEAAGEQRVSAEHWKRIAETKELARANAEFRLDQTEGFYRRIMNRMSKGVAIFNSKREWHFANTRMTELSVPESERQQLGDIDATVAAHPHTDEMGRPIDIEDLPANRSLRGETVRHAFVGAYGRPLLVSSYPEVHLGERFAVCFVHDLRAPPIPGAE